MNRFAKGDEIQRALPRVFRLNPQAPREPQWSDRWVDDGWIRLCESSDPVALRWAVATELRNLPPLRVHIQGLVGEL